MASKEVVGTRARVQLQHVLEKLAKEKGDLRLAMLIPSESPDKWNLLVSAPWMDSKGPRSIIADLTSRLLQTVDKNFLSTIDRVSVLQGSDPFVQGMAGILQSFLGVEASAHEGGFHIWRFSVAGRDITDGFVFVANQNTNGKSMKSSANVPTKAALH